MEIKLKAIVDRHHAPSDLTLTYDDMHGLWGGSILTLPEDCSLERQTNSIESATAEINHKQISEYELLESVRLLVELSAWEQRTPDSQVVLDESRAHLKIASKGARAEYESGFNEMPTNRLIQIKTRMESLYK
jgi:hypothetical protein